MYPSACCLLVPTSKHTLLVKLPQTHTHYESNPTSKQQATLQLVACLLSRANVVSGNKQTAP